MVFGVHSEQEQEKDAGAGKKGGEIPTDPVPVEWGLATTTNSEPKMAL
jgi:hypothetical protein